ncbi:MAG: VanZ family protein [Pseudomonadales bacterium]
MVTRLLGGVPLPPAALLVCRILFFCWIAFVVYASLTPVDFDSVDFPHVDKLMHFAIHGFNVLFVAIVFPSARLYIYGLLFVFLLGPTIELLQSLTPDRSASLADQVANTLGFFVAFLLVRFYRRQVETS